MEEVFHLLVEGCASDDAFVEVPSQCGIEFVADLPIDHLLEDGDGSEGSDVACAQDGEDLLLYNLLQDEWHDDDHHGLDVVESLDDDMG